MSSHLPSSGETADISTFSDEATAAVSDEELDKLFHVNNDIQFKDRALLGLNNIVTPSTSRRLMSFSFSFLH
ncbi:hypothetical protein K435DRAFT_862008 [Dendrothele bispora CBS 962.96]|uniref:Uncharacterized protein n=1 Tax=Dendrothele bispora (strain CBS 962.96) TaxID=1314807 RepID=A0A4S8LTU6_DENBC|nr:hypothetical protein K435DRAFT_862008 [Dendrothele bispora CBS 962.96]